MSITTIPVIPTVKLKNPTKGAESLSAIIGVAYPAIIPPMNICRRASMNFDFL